jgi:O-antigen/teichoic acid export membrane protein
VTESHPEFDIKQLRKRATSGARWTGTSTGVRIAAQFAQLAILARLLKVSDFGLMAMVNVALQFATTFTDSGVSNAIIHYRDATKKELSSLYWLNVISGAVVVVAMWFIAPLAAKVYHQPPLVPLLRVASTVFIVVAFGQQFATLSERDLRFRRMARIEISSIVVSAVVGIWLAWKGNGVWSLVWSNLAAAVITSGALTVIGWSQWRPEMHFDLRECRRFLRFGMFQMGERTLNLLGQQLDKIVIGIVMGATPLGYYDMASRLTARPYQLINPIFTRVAFPVFSAVQKDRERLRKGYLELMEVLTGLTIPIYVGMMVLAAPFVLVQLGEKFTPSIPLLQILSIVGFAFALSSPAGSLILACGRADIGFYLNVLRTGMILAGIYVGAHWGLKGIAWAMVGVVTAVMFPVHAYVRWKLVHMTLGQFMKATQPFFWSSLAAAVPCVALHYLVHWPRPLVELTVLTILYVAIYAGSLWWFARSRIHRVVRLVKH